MKKTLCVLLTLALAMAMLVTASADGFNPKDSNGYDQVIFEKDPAVHTAGYFWRNGLTKKNVGDLNAVKGIDEAYPDSKAIFQLSNEGADHYGRPTGNLVYKVGTQTTSGQDDSTKNPATNLTAEEYEMLSKSKIEIDVAFNGPVNSNIHFIEYDCDGSILNDVAYPETVLTSFSNDGTYTMAGSAVTYNYEAGAWYKFVYYLDHANNTYTAYCNGTLVAKDLTLSSRGASAAVLTFGVKVNQKVDGDTHFMYMGDMKYSVANPYKYNATINPEDVIVSADFNWPDDVDSSSWVSNHPDLSKQGTTFIKDLTTADPTLAGENNEHQYVFRGQTYNGAGNATANVGFNTAYSKVNPTTPEEIARAKKQVFKFDIALKKAMSLNVQFINQNSSAFTPATFTTSGTISFANCSNTVGYETMKWNTLMFFVDFESGTYSVCLNGNIVVDSAALPNAANHQYAKGAKIVTGTNTSNMYYYVDNAAFSYATWDRSATLSRTAANDYNATYVIDKSVSETGAVFIAATYEDDGLVNVNFSEKALGAEDNKAIVSIGYTKETGQTTKLFLWDSLTTMKPLIAAMPAE